VGRGNWCSFSTTFRILFADSLRILLEFAAFCRAKLLNLFRIRALFGTLDQHIGVRIPGGSQLFFEPIVANPRTKSLRNGPHPR
jgi:hypothetical protein